jgi:RimJ/RimL family protein N-acetyltransferase
MKMKYFRTIILGLILNGCSAPDVPHTSDSLQNIAQHYNTEWNSESNRPHAISGGDGFILKPCDASNVRHQDLFIYLYTLPESVKGYLDGKPKSTPEALHILINQSYRWEDGNFLSGFVGLAPDGTPFMHCGIGLFPNKNMAELFIIELPGFRNQGYGKKAIIALDRWAKFLNKAGTTVDGDRKSEIRTLIARVSPDNIPAIKLLIGSGFKFEFKHNEFKDELNEPRPDHVTFTHQQISVNGKSHTFTVMTTPKRPDPMVIFFKRINEN